MSDLGQVYIENVSWLSGTGLKNQLSPEYNPHGAIFFGPMWVDWVKLTCWFV